MTDLNELNGLILRRMSNPGLDLTHDATGGIYLDHPIPPLAWGDNNDAPE